MKILLWVLVAFAIAMWLSHSKKQRVKAARENPPPPAAPAVPESMVRCDHCGTFFPLSEAVTLPSGMHFCCQEHRQQHSSPDQHA